MSKRTTMGQLLVNSALPEELRDYNRKISKSNVQELLESLADNPEQYKATIKKLFDVGARVAHRDGASVSMRDLQPSKAKTALVTKFNAAVNEILDDNTLTQEAKEKKIVDITLKLQPVLGKRVYDTALKEGNRLAEFASEGVRGGPSQVQQMLGGPIVVTDNKSAYSNITSRSMKVFKGVYININVIYPPASETKKKINPLILEYVKEKIEKTYAANTLYKIRV